MVGEGEKRPPVLNESAPYAVAVGLVVRFGNVRERGELELHRRLHARLLRHWQAEGAQLVIKVAVNAHQLRVLVLGGGERGARRRVMRSGAAAVCVCVIAACMVAACVR